MPPFTITVLGSGTSMGVPTLGCDCGVCTSDDPRDIRLRPSVMVEYDGRTVLIDTTPDFRQQALRERILLWACIWLPRGLAPPVKLRGLRRYLALG